MLIVTAAFLFSCSHSLLNKIHLVCHICHLKCLSVKASTHRRRQARVHASPGATIRRCSISRRCRAVKSFFPHLIRSSNAPRPVWPYERHVGGTVVLRILCVLAFCLVLVD